ncbi:MAG: acyltransferase [Haloplasmataceae bacterium]|jgi:1-acyl-sn-glycerol-3-phosphate acyltransferase|nr:acyltransferase [Haloplasmataceae bacterium]
MNRVYLLPKIIIVFISLIIITKLTAWYYLLLFFIVASILVLLYCIADISAHAYYYQHLMKKGKTLNKEKVYSVVHQYLKTVNVFMRMDVKVFNYERFDKNKTYLITPNHQSNLDATVMLEVFKSPFFYVAKHQLKKVPMIAPFMRDLGCLFLNKDDMRGQVKIMSEVVDKLNEGNSAIIFPEGRRSFSSKLNEFKPGTFKMATKTQVDILPVTLNNVYKVKDNYPFRKTVVNVYIHEPISYDEYKDLDTQEIAEMVKAKIVTKIEE